MKKPLCLLSAIVAMLLFSGIVFAESSRSVNDEQANSIMAARNVFDQDSVNYTNVIPSQVFTQAEIDSVQKHISPEIVGRERDVMTNVLLTLDEEDRENAVFVDANNNVYATSKELKNATLLVEEIPTRGKGGPYRRVVSPTGYCWETAYVRLGTKNTDMYVPNSTETPYLYLGGTSSTSIEVDAGVQYSYSNDNWALYLKDSTGSAAITNAQYRYKANQDAFLKFYAPSNNNVTLSCTAICTDGIQRIQSYTKQVDGWRTNGTGCKVKRATTIAQTSENFNSTSYHKNAHWRNAQLGTSGTSGNYFSWNNITPVFTSFPANSPKVSVVYISNSEEKDTIDLTKK